MKKPAEADDDTANKFAQAMVLTGGDHELSTAVLQVDRYKNNAWRDCIAGTVNEDLKTEWNAINTCGFGHQKIEPMPDLYILVSLFVYPKTLKSVRGNWPLWSPGASLHHHRPPPTTTATPPPTNIFRQSAKEATTHGCGPLDRWVGPSVLGKTDSGPSPNHLHGPLITQK